jgi:hypothetical protein
LHAIRVPFLQELLGIHIDLGDLLIEVQLRHFADRFSAVKTSVEERGGGRRGRGGGDRGRESIAGDED